MYDNRRAKRKNRTQLKIIYNRKNYIILLLLDFLYFFCYWKWNCSKPELIKNCSYLHFIKVIKKSWQI
nr:MAG TPA: hypothetical protein [Caudoviricetes sp.]